jgi:hypothetical protein
MPTAVSSKQLVAAPSRMTTENFRLHMNHRHLDSLTDGRISQIGFTWDVEQPYRAFHRNLHLRTDLDHEHSPEPPEAAIEFALQCLLQNRLFGWRQVAGTKGVVSAFPDGSFGIRLDTRGKRTEIQYFNEIPKVAKILMNGRFPR